MNKYETLVEKARQAYKNEELESAAELYEEAFLQEVHLEDLMHLGAIYIDLKKYNKAIQIFKDLISIQEDNFLAYYGLGSCYNDLGRSGEAISAFKQAITYKEDYSDAYFGIALLLDYKDDEECEKYYLKTLEFEPDHYWANANLGPFYEKKERFDLALQYSKKAYLTNPDGPLISYNLGVINSKLKNYDDAVKYYREELTKENPFIDVYLNLGLIYKDIYKDYNTALIYYLEGIAKDKDNVNLWYNLGCLYVLMEDYDNAYNCLLYANLKDHRIRDYMAEDKELDEFKKSEEYEKLINTIKG